jgi:hypothetical protein
MAAHIPGARLVELEGDDHWWWLDDVDVLLDSLLALRDASDAQVVGLLGGGSEAGASAN